MSGTGSVFRLSMSPSIILTFLLLPIVSQILGELSRKANLPGMTKAHILPTYVLTLGPGRL